MADQRSLIFPFALLLAAASSGTVHAQLIDTAPVTDGSPIQGSNRGASVKIQTDTQVFITRLDADVQPALLGTDVKFVIWNATTGQILHETASQATLLSSRGFLQSPALAFNSAPGGQYVLSMMSSGSMTWYVDRATTENVNSIRTLAQGDVQTTYGAPNQPPLMTQNFDARFRIHGFILNDNDNDNVVNETDNCPFQSNQNQTDSDGDGLGDACDPETNDEDGDGALNPVDNCPFVDNPGQEDVDGDGLGDACDKQDGRDYDDDDAANEMDNCPFHSNPDQADEDGDGVGDACDDGTGGSGDPDGDGVGGMEDNCPFATNADQKDTDKDGIGDICDFSIIVDGSGCSTTGNGSAALALVALGFMVLPRRRRARK